MTNPNDPIAGHGTLNANCCALTKRELFAAIAMARWTDHFVSAVDARPMAKKCVEIADALILALNATEGEK